jgi:thioredoxin-related protein
MKKLLFTLATVCGLGLPAFAADLNWFTDFAKAKAQAKAEGKLVMLDFTGSDFCPPCIRLAKEVFPTKEFSEYAKKHLVLMEVDFPAKKKQAPELKAANHALYKEYKVDGYPTLLIVTPEGKSLGEVEFDLADGKAKDVIAAIEKLTKKAKP